MWGFKIANFINSHYIIRILWLKLNFIIKVLIKIKQKAMREAIDIALFGTNVQCNFKNLPDHLILEDMILEKAVAGKKYY